MHQTEGDVKVGAGGEQAVMANPVYFDTRDGCTWLGTGTGAMHLFFTDQTDPSDTRIPPPPCVHR
ncbi:MAG: hypothetical protein IJA83_00275, partial [Clostridia bacterium]|nr:hypothetical protein [Clostridia bacterium]